MKFILERINLCRKKNWPATHKNIWQGSFDVYPLSEPDTSKERMKQAEKEGLIRSEKIWFLTDKGRNFLKS